MLNDYKAGIDVLRIQMREVQPPEPVLDAFRDVQTSRADMERAVNQAETYRNDVVPRARGAAEKVIQEAKAYEQEVVAKAEGEASRFNAVYEQYNLAKDVTKKRMYLETMEGIMSGMNKIIMEQGGGNGVVPYLPLDSLNKGNK